MPHNDDTVPEFDNPPDFHTHALSPDSDGIIEVWIGSDETSAHARFIPPSGNGAPATRDYALSMLSQIGVVEGISIEDLDKALEASSLDRVLVDDAVIARNRMPVDEVPERITIDKKYLEQESPDVEANSVDFKAISAYTIVAAGEQIGNVLPSALGMDGTDIYGKQLPFRKAPVRNFILEHGVERSGDMVRCTVPGRLVIEGNTVLIQEVLVVKGDVDYHTGHIVFPGDVSISGTIKDGFKVYSGASIHVKDTLDAFDINAKKDLICSQGIIGQAGGRIRVGGSLRAKFVQNCSLAIKGIAQISGAIVNCRFFSIGKLDMGERGRIVGSEVYAVHGIHCGSIGVKGGKPVRVHVGVDFAALQRLEEAKARMQELTLKLQRLEQLAHDRPDTKLVSVKQELERVIKENTALMVSLNERVDVSEDAFIEVIGEIHPGVEIDLCRTSMTIAETMRRCRFSYNKAGKRIIIERGEAKAAAPEENPG